MIYESWNNTMYEGGIPANDASSLMFIKVYIVSLYLSKGCILICYHYFTSLCSYIIDHSRAQHDHFSVIVPWVIISGLCCYYYFMSLHESDCVHVSVRLLVLKPISITSKSKILYWISFAFLYCVCRYLCIGMYLYICKRVLFDSFQLHFIL